MIPNAVQTSGITDPHLPQRNSPDGKVRVLFLGRLIRSKRVDRFLRALALARRTAPQLTGLIAGGGPERESAERLAQELGLNSSQAAFLGHTENVRELLGSADLLVFTSDDLEGSPNSILEAMAAGVPVITTACGDAPSLIEDGKSGMCADST